MKIKDILPGTPLWYFPWIATINISSESFQTLFLLIQSHNHVPALHISSSSFLSKYSMPSWSLFIYTFEYLQDDVCRMSVWCLMTDLQSVFSLLLISSISPIALLYSAFGVIIEKTRGAEDDLNTVAAGTMTGMLYKCTGRK